MRSKIGCKEVEIVAERTRASIYFSFMCKIPSSMVDGTNRCG